MGKDTGSGGRGSFNRRGRTFAASVRLQEQITSVSSQLASARAGATGRLYNARERRRLAGEAQRLEGRLRTLNNRRVVLNRAFGA